MKQKTLSREYEYEGLGLHTGKYSKMIVCPAPENTGIRFIRTDIGPDAFVDALAENVSATARSTTITNGVASVRTIEHILSALTGLGVDNAIIRVDAEEVPILDGSARFYVEQMGKDPLVEQAAERKWVELKEEINIVDGKTGSYVKITPSDSLNYNVTIDFNSKVLGVQKVRWNENVDYRTEVGPCRTFCFLHEIYKLLLLGMVKGGSLKNAIIVVEKPMPKIAMKILAKRCRQPMISVTPEGYLDNLTLHFNDECGRHKLLDLMGDLRLAGGFIKADITAYKPGHRINTLAAKSVREKTK